MKLGPNRARQLKIFYSADVHGSDVAFRKWVNAVKVFKPDVLIMGGDLTGKFVVPIVRSARGRYSSEFYGPGVLGEEELLQFEARLRATGKYWVVMDPEEKAKYDAAPDTIHEELFRPLIRDSVRDWLEVVACRVDTHQTRVCMMLGNDDDASVAALLDEYECVENVDDKVTDLGNGFQMVSLGYSNETPWHTARELTEQQMSTRLDRLFRLVPDGQEAILNVHVPPKDTTLDQAAALDEALRPKMHGGHIVTTGVGSTAVREVIERYEPVLGLHGHIHESAGSEQMGGTFVLNPGSEYTEGVLRGVFVVVEPGRKVRSWQAIHG